MRQWLQQNPTAGKLIAGVILAIALIIMYVNLSGDGRTGLSEEVYFYDTEAEELVAMPRGTPSPAEDGDATLVEAYVASCGEGGEPQVVYLRKLTPEGLEAKKELDELMEQENLDDNRWMELENTIQNAERVKRPGDDQWRSDAGELIYQWTEQFRQEQCDGERYVSRYPGR